MARLEVVEEKCVGCGACVTACPFNAITMENSLAAVNDRCTLCGACVEACPYGALVLRKETAGPDAAAAGGYRGVMKALRDAAAAR